MEYIEGKTEKAAGCIFDRSPELLHSKKDLILYRNPLTVVLLNRFPYANGHLLVAPSRHVRGLADLSRDENLSLMQMIRDCVTILTNHFSPGGFNIGLNLGATAGAGLAEHLHFHIVPRWQGDHNFMAVLADIRTIPEHIEKTFDRLLPDFNDLPQS